MQVTVFVQDNIFSMFNSINLITNEEIYIFTAGKWISHAEDIFQSVQLNSQTVFNVFVTRKHEGVLK